MIALHGWENCHHELHDGAPQKLAVSGDQIISRDPAKVGMLLTEPDSKIKLAAGFGRHWPDARGVFVCDAW